MKYLLVLLTIITFIKPVISQNDSFSWDNASIYFLMTDRFFDGDPGNNNSYGRGNDPVGGFQGGDFEGITQKITSGYFDELGINVIWFSAAYEQIHGAVPGYWNGFPMDFHYAYHGYYPLDYTETDLNFGTALELQAMVDSAHAHGIRMIMDINMNHVGYETVTDAANYNFGTLGDPWSGVPPVGLDKTNPSWCNWWVDDNGNSWIRKGLDGEYCSPAAGGDDLTLSLAGLPDIRTDMQTNVGLPKILQNKWSSAKLVQEQNELVNFYINSNYDPYPVNYVIKWMCDWVRDFGIDGFRIDTYKHIEREHWGRLKDQVQIAFDDWKTNNPSKVLDNNDFWMIAEWFGHGPEKNNDIAYTGKTDAVLNFHFQFADKSYQNLDNIYTYYDGITNSDPDWNFASYLSSHDTEMYISSGNDMINAGTALAFCPGAIQIYYGDESGRIANTTNTDQDMRTFMNWQSIDQNVLDHWQKIMSFRKRHPAIGAGAHIKLDQNPYYFLRTLGDDVALTGLGLNGGTQMIDVSDYFQDTETIVEAYTGDTLIVTNGSVPVNVHANGIVMFEYGNGIRLPKVQISPTKQNHKIGTVTVTLNGNLNSVVYYSLDGSDPDINSILYTGPFSLSGAVTDTTIIKAIAINQDGSSSIAEQRYTFDPNPQFYVHWNPDGTCASPYIYVWNIDEIQGSAAPWPGELMEDLDNDGYYDYLIEGEIANIIFNCGSGSSQTNDLENISASSCWFGEPSGSNGWQDCPEINLISLSIAPASGNYSPGTILITLGGNNNNAVYYSIDGSAPDSINSTLYTAPFNISGSDDETVTVRAVAYNNSGNAVYSEEIYNFNTIQNINLYWNTANTCNTPYVYYWNINDEDINPVSWPGVAMTDSDNDGFYEYSIQANSANVIFNCNGSSQSNNIMNVTDDLCWFGEANGSNGSISCNFNSDISISPTGKNFDNGFGLITIDQSNDDLIYYTLDGSIPDNNIGILYESPFIISETMSDPIIVNAVSFNGNEYSPVVSETYTFDAGLTFYWDPQGNCTEPYIYYWNLINSNESSVSWPGVEMTDEDGDGWYEYNISADQADIIFSCNGSPQTEDLNNISNNACWSGASDDEGGWISCPDLSKACDTYIETNDGANSFKAFYIKSDAVLSFDSISYQAAHSIELISGFSVFQGKSFTAEILLCNELE